MIFSFRTRLFVIAGLIVGAVLATVMVLSWSRVLAYEVQRLDGRLCMEARRLVSQPFRREDLPRLQGDIMGKLYVSRPEQLMLRFEASDGRPNSQSPSEAFELAFDSPQWQLSRDPNASAPPGGRPEQPQRFDRPPPRREGEDARPAPPPRAPEGACALASFESQGHQWRGARQGVPGQRSMLAVDLAATETELQGALTEALKLVIPMAIVLTALGAWLLSALTMRPVNRLRDAMKDVTQKALDRRLSTQGEDREFKVLISAYNTMLARLEASFQQASRFSADAAHELKTPLTILQGRLEQALNKADEPAVQHELAQLLDEVGRLSTITRKLLLLSQADAGWLALHRTTIDLSDLLDDMAVDAQMLLTQQTLTCDIERYLSMQGDAVLLRQLFNNLISNAVRYCRPNGGIKLSARKLPTGLEIVFSNTTDTITAAHRSQFFDRFYRGDAAHNRQVDGHGLGLSLAREIARAHGGDLVLLDTSFEIVTLQLTLPS
jgi:two-component system, OmpR family, heavy metal sensor histidine kinase CusS